MNILPQYSHNENLCIIEQMEKKLFHIILLAFFMSLNGFAQQDQQNDKEVIDKEEEKRLREFYLQNIEKTVISSLYRRGEYLIYDCINKHFVCVIDQNYERCRIPGKKNVVYDSNFCLRIKQYDNQPRCFLAHEKLSDKTRMNYFCKREMRKN